MPEPEGLLCSTHGDVAAGWRCKECERFLCSACTASVIGRYYCCACDDREAKATQLTEPRANKPFLDWLIECAVYPLRRAHFVIVTGVLIGLVGAATGMGDGDAEGVMWLLGQLHVLLLALVAVWAINMAARRGSSSFVAVMLRSVVSTAIVWLPLVAYMVLVDRPLTGALAKMYIFLAIVYVPIALVGSATDAGLKRVVNPFVNFDWIWALGGRYPLYVGFAALLSLGAVKVLRSPLDVSETQLVNTLATVGVAIVFLTMSGRMLGTLAWVHGVAFDWGYSELYMDPIHPKMKTTGRRKPPPKLGKKAGVDGEASDSAEGESGTYAGPELDPAERQAVGQVLEHLRGERMRRALDLYMVREPWREACFEDRHLVSLGNAARIADMPDVAKRLLQLAFDRQGASASSALYALAKLHATSLNQPGEAKRLYRQAIEEYPDTDAGRLAKREVDDV